MDQRRTACVAAVLLLCVSLGLAQAPGGPMVIQRPGQTPADPAASTAKVALPKGARPDWVSDQPVGEDGGRAYCAAGSSSCNPSYSDEYIVRVQVGAIDNSSAYEGGCYGDYTSLSTNMAVGTPYSITVTNNYCWDGDLCGVWVDWNQDQDFDEAGEFFSLSGCATFTGTITPPGGALPGPTRMRVRIQYQGTLAPCGTTNYGEVEDYTVNVQNIACTHQICLTDSYGDGWDVANVTVYVNGIAVLTNITLAYGYGPLCFGFQAATGDAITTAYVGGFYPDENSYYIYDGAGTLICSAQGSYPNGPPNCSTTGYCALTGACCRNYDQSCEDGVLQADCSGPHDTWHMGQICAQFACPPPNDQCQDMTPVPLPANTQITFAGDNTGATLTNDCLAFSQYPNVWHGFTTTECLDITLDYCQTAPAFGMAWVNLAIGCSVSCSFTAAGTYDWTTCGEGNLTIRWTGIPAGEYWYPVLKDPVHSAVGPYVLHVIGQPCPPPEPGDTCNPPLPAGFFGPGSDPFEGQVTTCGRGNDYSNTCLGYYDDGEDILFSFVVEEEVCLNITAIGATPADNWIGMAVDDVCPPDATCIAMATSGSGNVAAISNLTLAPGTYYLMVDTYPAPTCVGFTLNIAVCPPPPPGDVCATAWEIASLPATVTGSTVGFNNDYDEVCYYSGSTSPDVVYYYESFFDVFVDIDLCDSGYDTKVYVYQDVCDHAHLVACNDDACTDPDGYPTYRSRLDCVPMPGGHTYYIVVDGYGGDAGNYTLTLAPCGACCFNDGHCEFLTETACTTATGVWQGPETGCTPNNCPMDPDHFYFSLVAGYPQGNSGGNSYRDPSVPDIGGWFTYPNYTWWNVWFPNEYAPNRPKRIHVTFDLSFGTGGGWAVAAVNWATPDWYDLNPNRPPLPADVPDQGTEDLYIGRYTFMPPTTLPGQMDFEFYLPVTYCPAWISMDIQGENYTISGVILHECCPPLTITCPPDMTVANDPGACGAVVNYPPATPAGGCPPVTVTYTQDSGTFFPVGTTTVTATATDDAGQTAACSFNVTVTDDEDPVATCPDDITVPADPSTCTAVVEWDASVTDNCPGAAIVCDPPSGSTFPIGTTAVMCTATDGAGNTDDCTFTVTVTGRPANDMCAGQTPVSEGIYPYDTTCATFDGPGYCMTSPNIWYCYYPTCSGWATITLTNASYSTMLAVYHDCYCYPTSPAMMMCCHSTVCTVWVQQGHPYLIEVGGTDNAAGTGTMTVTCSAEGACCFWDGTCQVMTADDCATAGGTYQGDGVSCDPNPCPPPEPQLQLVPTSTECYHVGDLVTVEIWMQEVVQHIVGAQFFLQYDATKLQLGGGGGGGAGAIVPGDAPMSVQVFECSTAQQTNPQCPSGGVVGQIDYAVGVPTPPGTEYVTHNWKLAVMHFTALAEVCNVTGVVDFRLNPPLETRLTDADGVPVYVPLVPMTAITIDSTPPYFTSCPQDITVGTDPSQCSAVVTWDTPTADDDCSPPATVEQTGGPPPGSAFPLGSTTITCTATDSCENTATCTFTVTVNDTEAPVAHCPADITVNAEAGGCSAVVTWDAYATDNCPGAAIACDPPSGSTFTGTTTVTCTATDAAGHAGTCSFTVTVLAFNDFVATVQLQGQMINTVQRCITFEFRDCPGGPLQRLKKTMTFVLQSDGTGLASATFTDLPCGVYNCVTAEDELHSLRAKVTPGINGSHQYTASFTGADMLLGGDLYNDNLIDIVDFGVFIAEWSQTYGGNINTPCTEPPTWPRHADINGNAAVDAGDFGFISANFLLFGDSACCPGPAPQPPPRLSIPVAEALALGLPAWVDLNGDGVLDTADITAFLNGVVPRIPDNSPTTPTGEEPAATRDRPQAPLPLPGSSPVKRFPRPL